MGLRAQSLPKISADAPHSKLNSPAAVPKNIISTVHTEDSSGAKPPIVQHKPPLKLPGAADHRILTLSDEELRSIPVSEMMSWYGEANGGGSCADDFGNQLVNRWRDTKASYCSPHGQSIQSSVDCYLVHQTRHHGNGDNLCLMKNVAVNLNLFADDSITTPVIQKYVSSRHFQQPYVPFPKDFIAGDCKADPSRWRPENMPGWNADLTTKAFTFIDNDIECEMWVDHPVLITQRDTFANFFHDSEDFVDVFLAMAILQWSPGETQHFLTDLYPEGPFW